MGPDATKPLSLVTMTEVSKTFSQKNSFSLKCFPQVLCNSDETNTLTIAAQSCL